MIKTLIDYKSNLIDKCLGDNMDLSSILPYQLHDQIKVMPFQYRILKSLLSPEYTQDILITRRRVGKDILAFSAMISYLMGWRYNKDSDEFYLTEETGVGIYLAPEQKQLSSILKNPASITLPDGSSMSFIDLIPKSLNPTINTRDNTIYLNNVLTGKKSSIVLSQLSSDGLRGNNFTCGVVTEFCTVSWDKNRDALAQIIPPISKFGKGFVLMVSTVMGNSSYQWYTDQKALDNPLWNIHELNAYQIMTWDNKIHEKDIIDLAKRTQERVMFEQEYMNLPMISSDAVYSNVILDIQEHKEDRVVAKDFNGLPVFVGIDLGSRNPAWVACTMIEHKPHIIGYRFERNIAPTVFIRKILDRFKSDYSMRVFLPHDSAKRNDGDGKTTFEMITDSFAADRIQFTKLTRPVSESDKLHNGIFGLSKSTLDPSCYSLVNDLATMQYSSSETSSVKNKDSVHLSDALCYLFQGLKLNLKIGEI